MNVTVVSDDTAAIVRRVSEDAGVELELDVELPASRTARILRLRSGRQELCLKLRHDDPFDAEALWHERMAAAGLPAPRIYAHGHCGPWNYALYEWLRGRSGHEGGVALGRALGHAVSRMHAESVGGVGTVRSGSWEAAQWGPFIEDNVRRFFKPRLQELADHQLSVFALERSLDALVHRCHAAQVVPRLLHSDLGLDNVIASDGVLVGLIDPGWCIGGDPLLDVSHFLMLGRSPTVREGFEATYAGFDGLDQPRLASYRAYHLIAKLIHRVDQGNRDRAAAYADQLRPLLERS